MGPILAALIPSLLAGGASLIGGAVANAANKKRAQEQMDYQERMSSTAYQRSMEDMRVAGLNPMLAFSQGGASSPGGAMARMEDVLSPAVSSAMQGKKLAEEIKLIRQQAAQLFIDNQGTSGLRQRLLESQIETQDAQTQHWLLQNRASRAEIPQLENFASVEKSRFGRLKAWSDRIRETVVPWLMAPQQIIRGGRSLR